MQFLRNTSIQRKQMLAIMLTSTAAVLLTCFGFAAYKAIAFRRELVENLTILAEVIGENSSGALDFNDSQAAEQMLSALRVEPNIAAACLYSKDGQVFAVYRRADLQEGFSPPRVEGDGHRFDANDLVLFRRIVQKGDTVGTVYLQSDLREMSQAFRESIGLVLAVLCASLLAALFLSSRLQQWLSKPILDLTRTARAVAVQKNYSLRAVKQSKDELGTLTDDFNEMLAQIQERETALRAANELLEQRVEERTRELEGSLSVLHAAIESTVGGILVVDRQGRVVTYNRKFAKMWQIPEDVLSSGKDKELLAAVQQQLRDPEEFLDKVRELYANPTAESLDTIDFKDGRVFERNSMPQYIRNEVVGRVWNFRDVTEQRRAEEALHESQSLYHSLVEQMPTGVFRKDAGGRFVFVNSWFCRLKGMEASKFLGRTPRELAAYELSKQGTTSSEATRIQTLAGRNVDHHTEIMQTGKQIVLEEQSTGVDGQPLHLHVVKSPVFGHNGKILGTQGVLLDVTQAKQAEAELKYERDLLKSLLDAIPDSIYFKDLQSRFVRLSRSKVERMFTYSLNQYRASHPDDDPRNLPLHLTGLEPYTEYLMGKTDFDFNTESEARVMYDEEQEIIRTGKPLLGKLHVRCTGMARWVGT